MSFYKLAIVKKIKITSQVAFKIETKVNNKCTCCRYFAHKLNIYTCWLAYRNCDGENCKIF